MNLEQKNQDEIQLHAQKEIKKGLVLLGSRRIQPGHRVFEFNTETKVLKQADKIQEKTIGWDEAKIGSKKTTRIKVNENCVYIHALNEKSAKKKLINEYKIAS